MGIQRRVDSIQAIHAKEAIQKKIIEDNERFEREGIERDEMILDLDFRLLITENNMGDLV